MKKILFCILLSLILFDANAQQHNSPFDSIVQSAVQKSNFEGTVLVADKGYPIYHKSFGYADKAKRVPIKNDTHFGIASITKMITAMIILQQVEEGKFSLTDNVQTLLPDFPIKRGKKITVHHLLLHISGLPNEKDKIYTKAYRPQEFVRQTLQNKYHRFESFNYANIDYVLLGLIIEKFDHSTWSESVSKRILQPLKMSHTGFLASERYPENFAFSFSFDAEANRNQDPLFFIENFYAAGCMYATATDLLRLDQAMYNDGFLSANSKKTMFRSYPKYNYSGYSVWTYNYPFAPSKPKIMERRGGILGSNSVIIRMIENNKTIIILSNNNQFNPDSFGDTKSLKEALMIAVANFKN